MTTDELKIKLKPAGILLACYFAVPLLAGWVLGARGALFGSITVPDLLQAGLGAAILVKLYALKEALAAELEARLGRKGQPREKTLELAGRIMGSAEYIAAAALLLPPLGGMFPASRLVTLAKFAAAGYTVYAAYAVWKLSEPFLVYVPPPEPVAPEEAPVAALGRCPRCGQQVDASMKVCAFCGEPVKLKD